MEEGGIVSNDAIRIDNLSILLDTVSQQCLTSLQENFGFGTQNYLIDFQRGQLCSLCKHWFSRSLGGGFCEQRMTHGEEKWVYIAEFQQNKEISDCRFFEPWKPNRIQELLIVNELEGRGFIKPGMSQAIFEQGCFGDLICEVERRKKEEGEQND